MNEAPAKNETTLTCPAKSWASTLAAGRFNIEAMELARKIGRQWILTEEMVEV